MEEQLDIESVFKFKVEELKQELGKRGLPKSGSKPDLQERLLQYVTNKSYIKEYEESESVNDSTVDNEKFEEEDLSEETLDKSDPLEEECSDKSEMVISNLDTTKDDEIIDIVTTPNEDDVSIPNDEDVDDDDDVDVDVDISPEKNDIDNDIKTTYTIENEVSDNVVNYDVVSEDTTLTDDNEVTSKAKVAKVKIISLPMSNGERKESRSKRFGGASSETEKKKVRLGRFFSSVSGLGKGEPVTEEDVEKIKKRAERFGAVSTILTKPDSSTDRLKVRQERFADSTLKKRQERFGVVQKQSLNLNSDMNARKQNRLAKFGAV